MENDYLVLKAAINEGIINLACVAEQLKMSKRKELLDQHPYKIWQGKNDGFWYTYIPDQTKGRKMIRRAARESVEDVVVDYWSKEERHTIDEIFHEWNDGRLELKRIEASTHDINTQIFKKHFQKLGAKKIEDVGPADFVAFLEQQIPEYDMTSKAFSNLKGLVKGIIRYAKRKGYVDYTFDDVFHELDTSERQFRHIVRADEDECFSVEETAVILGYLSSERTVRNLAILLMFISGIRVGELVALKWEDVCGEYFLVRRTESRRRKPDGSWDYFIKDFPKTKAGWRKVVIPEQFCWIWEAVKEASEFEGEYVFMNSHGEHITTNGIRRRLERVCDRLGIKKKSPHKIRKTFISMLIDNNLDSQLITSLAGHTSIMTSEIHYHRDRKDTAEKVEAISSLPEFKNVVSGINEV